jgi:hypothetical protein
MQEILVYARQLIGEDGVELLDDFGVALHGIGSPVDADTLRISILIQARAYDRGELSSRTLVGVSCRFSTSGRLRGLGFSDGRLRRLGLADSIGDLGQAPPALRLAAPAAMDRLGRPSAGADGLFDLCAPNAIAVADEHEPQIAEPDRFCKSVACAAFRRLRRLPVGLDRT